MSDVPEVFIKVVRTEAQFVSENVPEEFARTSVNTYEPVCDNVNCGELEVGATKSEALKIAELHKQWHAEGMPL